jgi:hypothetical protein
MPIQPDASHSTPTALPYGQLPLADHRGKWQVRLAYVGFYLFIDMGWCNLWPTAPLVKLSLHMSRANGPMVSLIMAATRVPCGILISFVKA